MWQQEAELQINSTATQGWKCLFSACAAERNLLLLAEMRRLISVYSPGQTYIWDVYNLAQNENTPS